MATIHREFEVPAAADAVWAALRDFGAVQALAPAMEQMMERGAQAMRSALAPRPR